MALSLVVDITAVIQGQSGQQFKTASSEVMRKGDGQSNDNSVALVPTAIYWKLQRILKPPNLNGSPTVKSPSPSLSSLCLPFCLHSSNLFIPILLVGLQRTWPRTQSDVAALLLSTSTFVLGLGCNSCGLYWRVISWIEISFQSIRHGALEAHSIL